MTNEILIPRHPSGSAKYYLVKIVKDGDYFKTTHKRIGKDTIGYSLTRIDCANKKYQDLAYGEDIDNITTIYSEKEWIELIEGSSKSDLVQFVCENYYGKKNI